jgi:hypothetical protein
VVWLDSITRQQYFSIVKIISFKINHNSQHFTVREILVARQEMVVLEQLVIVHLLMEEPMAKLIFQISKLQFRNLVKQLVL